MNGLESTIQENFYAINLIIGVLLLFTYALLLRHLISHMRQMVRLKYHVDKRAEFDESRVKIVIAIIFFLFMLYLLIWGFCLFTLDISNYEDYLNASSMFKAINACLLVCAYAVYFINNRVLGDINHIKKTLNTKEDQSQGLLNHL